jgi:hypothetical protein
MVDLKVLVYSNFRGKNLDKNEISKLHEEWKISPSQVQEKGLKKKLEKWGATI